MPNSSPGAPHCQPLTSPTQHKSGYNIPLRTSDTCHRQGYWHCSSMGGRQRQTPLAGIYNGTHLLAQPPSRRRNGIKAQWVFRQHHHASWAMDVPHIPHLHSHPDWSANGGSCKTNEHCIHISKCWMTTRKHQVKRMKSVGREAFPRPRASRYKMPGRDPAFAYGASSIPGT